LITSVAAKIFFTNLSTMIGEAYSATPTLYKEFASVIPTETEVFTDGWTGMLDQMRPWVGSRVTKEPAPQTYSVSVLPFEQTVTLDRFQLDDDKFGLYYRMLPDMARQAARWPDYQLRNLLEGLYPWAAGSYQNGLDGLPNFSQAHPIDLYNPGLGTYSNLFTGGGLNVSGILVGGAFSPTAFATLYEYMSVYKAEDNESMDVTPNRLMHPSQLKTEVELVLKNMMFAPPAWATITGQVGAADNVFKRFGVEPLENKLLKNASNWYLMDTTKAILPFRWILRQAVEFVQRTNEQDPSVFDDHRYLYGDWGRAAAAWSFAWLCAKSGP
jgi:phage major head subunit gpT-like protein